MSSYLLPLVALVIIISLGHALPVEKDTLDDSSGDANNVDVVDSSYNDFGNNFGGSLDYGQTDTRKKGPGLPGNGKKPGK